MRREVAVLTVVVASAAIFAACRGLGSPGSVLQERSGNSQSTAEARRVFDHQSHEAIFSTANVLCIDCHRFDQAVATGDAAVARAVSAHGLNPGSAACHTCHIDSGERMAEAPDACSTCHQNMAPLVPEDHLVAWSKVHASAARIDATSCDTCHRQSFCIDCHQRRDDVQQRVHDRNFRFTHSIVARANPMQCGSCHRPDYCSNCHQQGQSGLP